MASVQESEKTLLIIEIVIKKDNEINSRVHTLLN